jgi:hypothetical protein
MQSSPKSEQNYESSVDRARITDSQSRSELIRVSKSRVLCVGYVCIAESDDTSPISGIPRQYRTHLYLNVTLIFCVIRTCYCKPQL